MLFRVKAVNNLLKSSDLISKDAEIATFCSIACFKR